MNKLTVSLLAAFAVAGTSFAGTNYVSSKEYKQTVVAPSCFKDQELSLDVFYSYNDGINNKQHYFRDRSGGGVGLNFFFARYFGVDVEGNWFDGAPNKDVIHQVTGNFIFRYPLETANFCWAPYIFGGGGGTFDGVKTGFGDAGAGLEFRFTPHIGFFSDWRYEFMGSHRNNLDTTRAGLRFVF